MERILVEVGRVCVVAAGSFVTDLDVAFPVVEPGIPCAGNVERNANGPRLCCHVPGVENSWGEEAGTEGTATTTVRWLGSVGGARFALHHQVYPLCFFCISPELRWTCSGSPRSVSFSNRRSCLCRERGPSRVFRWGHMVKHMHGGVVL